MTFKSSRWMFSRRAELFDEGVIYFVDHGRHLREAGKERGAVTASSRDNHITAFARCDQDGLPHSVLFDGQGKVLPV